MHQAQAEAEAGRLNEEHPDRQRFQWVAFPDKSGLWAVVRTLRSKRVDPLTATTEAKPKPPEAEDPRGPLRGISGYG
jgi:hypothetical protein